DASAQSRHGCASQRAIVYRQNPKAGRSVNMMKWKLGAALAMSAALLAACSDDDDDITDPEPGVASVRVVHAAGAAPAVLNVDVGDQRGATNVMFGNAAERLDVAEGDWTFSVISPEGEAPVTLFDTTRTPVEGERLSSFIV